MQDCPGQLTGWQAYQLPVFASTEPPAATYAPQELGQNRKIYRLCLRHPNAHVIMVVLLNLGAYEAQIYPDSLECFVANEEFVADGAGHRDRLLMSLKDAASRASPLLVP